MTSGSHGFLRTEGLYIFFMQFDALRWCTDLHTGYIANAVICRKNVQDTDHIVNAFLSPDPVSMSPDPICHPQAMENKLGGKNSNVPVLILVQIANKDLSRTSLPITHLHFVLGPTWDGRWYCSLWMPAYWSPPKPLPSSAPPAVWPLQ